MTCRWTGQLSAQLLHWSMYKGLNVYFGKIQLGFARTVLKIINDCQIIHVKSYYLRTNQILKKGIPWLICLHMWHDIFIVCRTILSISSSKLMVFDFFYDLKNLFWRRMFSHVSIIFHFLGTHYIFLSYSLILRGRFYSFHFC